MFFGQGDSGGTVVRRSMARRPASHLMEARYKAPRRPCRSVPTAQLATLVAAALALCLLLAPPTLAWYKQAAGPNSYSVGHAAGLLSGFRGSQYARRSEPPVGAGPFGRAGSFPELRPSPWSPTVCVKDVTPNLHSCQPLPDGRASFLCKADVFLSLRASQRTVAAPEAPPDTWTSLVSLRVSPAPSEPPGARDGDQPLPTPSPQAWPLPGLELA
ncbi:neuropeptide B [Rhinolophus ferrumequinum]|uniref:neuropeptide B n=1 Tax=Rhinolophus ferrumequinum TaxID=59479 RepID=UPI00140F8681|nr:neuropeptide B [Rhinolophus ferrumequinum]